MDVVVIGLGGAGMYVAPFIQDRLNCRALAVNTDADALKKCRYERKLLLGPTVCGGGPAHTAVRGRRAAEESHRELAMELDGARTLIIAAGLGGGTGTGAAPAVVALARSLGLEVAVAVILPFEFETGRREPALEGLAELEAQGVHLVCVDNAEMLQLRENHHKPLLEAFEASACSIADAVCRWFEARAI